VRDPRDVENWRADAKCLGKNTELWYPPRDKDLYTEIATQSKAICLGKDGLPPCPVRQECLLYAYKKDEEYGIWGGLSRRERNALVRKAERNGLTLEEWLEKK